MKPVWKELADLIRLSRPLIFGDKPSPFLFRLIVCSLAAAAAYYATTNNESLAESLGVFPAVLPSVYGVLTGFVLAIPPWKATVALHALTGYLAVIALTYATSYVL